MLPFRHHHLLQILDTYEETNLPLDRLIYEYFKNNKSLGSKDRAFIAETAYGIVRWRGLLDHIGNPNWLDRLNTYLNGWDNDPSLPPHIRLSFPKDLYALIQESWGERADEICLASNYEAPTTIRVNTLKTSRKELMARLSEAFISKETPTAIHFKRRLPLFSMAEFKEGLFEMQDEASQQVAALVEAKPGDHVLDYCSGSGGKTLAFAPQMQGKGQIYLHDIRTRVLQEAKRRLKRAGVQNAQLLETEKLNPLKKKCDWVLVDAPCTGTGTLRRNPDMKWRFTPDMLQRLIGEQRSIFEKALSYLKPSGKIVYATCSILKQENQDQIDHFVKTYNLKIEKEPLQTVPTKDGPDGFFGAVLLRD